MKKILSLLLMATVALDGCKAVPPPGAGNGADGSVNADDGKHTISELGKWKYGTVVAPAPAFPQCRWEVWGLQKDGWKQLYKGHGIGKVELPPAGVYSSAYFKSKGCGAWHGVRK